MKFRWLWLVVSLLYSTAAAGTAAADTLSTNAINNNGNAGIMFDVTAANDLTITGLSSYVAVAGTFNVYGKSGSYVGFDTSSAGWTLLGTTVVGGTGMQSVIGPLSVPIPAGQTYAFHVVGVSGAQVNYETRNTEGSLVVSDANLSIFEGRGKAAPFSAASNSGRVPIVTITYNTGLTPTPTIVGLSPASGSSAGGDAVTITGTNFTGATAVTFGGVPATSFTVDSATQITATAPAGTVGTAEVRVTTPDGTSADAGGADDFTYTVPVVPTMTEWAMILFGILMAGGAAIYLQRRRGRLGV